jgi:predicted dehydrogenase
MSDGVIRVGIVGAGNNTRVRHIPGLREMEGVEIVSVCNRSRESGERVAGQFEIPRIYDNWLELVEADDTDAICIGTWPYMHCPVTLAALENNKHVLCEARMAMNAQEAHAMLAAARRKPHLVTQIVPSPFTFKVDSTIQEHVASGYLGDVLSIDLRVTDSSFVDTESNLHWRQDRDLSGYNILGMGIWYEAIMRWVGPASRVMAMTRVCAQKRRDESGEVQIVTVPDHVDITCEMACGAQAHMSFSTVTGLAPASEVWLYGTEGTLRLEGPPSLALYGGRRGDDRLAEIPVPAEKQGGWRVEEEFVNAIRGKEKVTRTSFEVGVQYMEFTEAVTRSAQTGRAIALPL